jgi:hypothetical protein
VVGHGKFIGKNLRPDKRNRNSKCVIFAYYWALEVKKPSKGLLRLMVSDYFDDDDYHDYREILRKKQKTREEDLVMVKIIMMNYLRKALVAI